MSFSNNVLVSLASPVLLDDDVITFVNAVAPFNNPPITGGIITLADNVNKPVRIEIITYTAAIDNGNGTSTLTGCSRAQEATNAYQWQVGEMAYMSLTAGEVMRLVEASDELALIKTLALAGL